MFHLIFNPYYSYFLWSCWSSIFVDPFTVTRFLWTKQVSTARTQNLCVRWHNIC